MTIEIMAPAGSFESLTAAIQGGADSIYFGVEQLNMRARSANFQLEDLPKIVAFCQKHNVKSYLTLNTIIYDHDTQMLDSICAAAKKAGVTAVICMDIAAIQMAKQHELEIHLSTQVNVTNIESVKFYSQFADVVVLARELTLKQITHICEQIKEQDIRGPKGKLIEIEIFVHGALCVAISGKCHMSLSTYNASANRGACLQNCRRSYKVIDEETGDELKIDNKYVMSPSDLCTLPFLDKIINSGVTVLKLEGRAKGPEYVKTVTRAYKEAAQAVLDGTYSKEKVDGWMKQVSSVFNRGFWEGGYYLGKKINEWTGEYGSKATKEKIYVGNIVNYYNKNKVAEVEIKGEPLSKGCALLITGPNTGAVEITIDEVRVDDDIVDNAPRHSHATFFCNEKVRLTDKVYMVKERE